MNFEIRNIQEDEIEETARVYAAAFNKANIGENWTVESANKFISHWFKKQSDLFFIAINEKKILGGVVAEIVPYFKGNDLTHAELFVGPNFQGQGIAKKLLMSILEEAIKKYNVKFFSGIADKKEDFPIHWYQKLGMKKTRWIFVEGDANKILLNLKEEK